MVASKETLEVAVTQGIEERDEEEGSKREFITLRLSNRIAASHSGLVSAKSAPLSDVLLILPNELDRLQVDEFNDFKILYQNSTRSAT